MPKKRIIVLDEEKCKSDKCPYQCMKVCPVNRGGDECIVINEETGFPVFSEILCIGCGLCVQRCRKLHYDAIAIVNLPTELDSDPVHRYGVNSFALYNLPIPQANAVTGIIGQNGIGKTTVMKILTGTMKCNLGKYDSDISWDDVIERFRGTQLQAHLELIREGKLSASFKPQNVDKLPKVMKGKVSDAIEKLPLKDKAREILKRFDMESMESKNISDLSGGELQVLAITAALSKDADLYFFDEPSSYLDVRQRLIAAAEIKRAAEKSAVLVVEHDLAVLDYLSDYVHIAYGEPGVFGIISKPYGVRVGINTYLDGFIREENVRFREKSVTFPKIALESGKKKPFITFPAFEKRFEGFSLKTEEGSLNKGEVIGVLGPNGTGKTTFIKMLSGDIKPDNGAKAIEGLRLSCKPQRIMIEKDDYYMTVAEYLERETEGRAAGSGFKVMARSLGAEKNMDKMLSSLSGGELQTVFILASLWREHDILLLDEPSAFLDVEQRLLVAKVIKDHILETEVSAFVVDHDLQFMDAIADRIMVFEGKSGVEGRATRPMTLKDGMNLFLKNLKITFRRDPQTGRARANKPGSQKDMEQKAKGEYYYMG